MGVSQDLMLFIRGNAISGAPSISGTSQLANPPVIAILLLLCKKIEFYKI
jgi:hypothetical protein